MRNAVLNFLKPPGMTSHDAVSFVRRIYGQKRVGHSGTLDPAASGVLPIYLGNATRLVEYAENFTKCYRTEILFGISTDTGDDTGAVLVCKNVSLPREEVLIRISESFRGQQEQIPPMFSAVKVNGKKLYDLARAGKEIERQSRRIDIADIRILRIQKEKVMLQLCCTKGTYVRVLCEDFGKRVGLPATMSGLLRIAVGPFQLSDALTMEEIEANPLSAVLPPDFAVKHLKPMVISPPNVMKLIYGQTITPECVRDDLQENLLVSLYDEQELFFGIGWFDSSSGRIQPKKIMRDGII